MVPIAAIAKLQKEPNRPMKQVTIIGTGLIGGSLGLALKKYRIAERVVGCDRAQVLEEARRRCAIDEGREDARAACAGSDVVVLATPVGAIIDLIEKLGPVISPKTLLTDVGSTKERVLDRARSVFGDHAGERFLPGHPMAGKESGGIEQADADLFAGAVWLFTPAKASAQNGEGQRPQRIREYIDAVRMIGARVIEMDATRHDRLCAWISHLPQFVSTALASALEDEFGDDPDVHAIGGRALREMTRLASSPYSMWRDIAITNEANVQEAVLALEQRLAHIRENLRTRELAEEFERAREFRNRKP